MEISLGIDEYLSSILEEEYFISTRFQNQLHSEKAFKDFSQFAHSIFSTLSLVFTHASCLSYTPKKQKKKRIIPLIFPPSRQKNFCETQENIDVTSLSCSEIQKQQIHQLVHTLAYRGPAQLIQLLAIKSSLEAIKVFPFLQEVLCKHYPTVLAIASRAPSLFHNPWESFSSNIKTRLKTALTDPNQKSALDAFCYLFKTPKEQIEELFSDEENLSDLLNYLYRNKPEEPIHV